MKRRYIDTTDEGGEPSAPPTLAAVEAQADEARRSAIWSALERTSGNVRLAALTLGLPRRTLDYRITKLGLRAWLTKNYPRSSRQPKGSRS